MEVSCLGPTGHKFSTKLLFLLSFPLTVLSPPSPTLLFSPPSVLPRRSPNLRVPADASSPPPAAPSPPTSHSRPSSSPLAPPTPPPLRPPRRRRLVLPSRCRPPSPRPDPACPALLLPPVPRREPSPVRSAPPRPRRLRASSSRAALAAAGARLEGGARGLLLAPPTWCYPKLPYSSPMQNHLCTYSSPINNLHTLVTEFTLHPV